MRKESDANENQDRDKYQLGFMEFSFGRNPDEVWTVLGSKICAIITASAWELQDVEESYEQNRDADAAICFHNMILNILRGDLRMYCGLF